MQNTSNGLSVAALVLSIVGVLTMLFGGSVVLGSLAILLALLSRGSGRMSGQAKAAIGISIVSIALGILLLIGMFVYVHDHCVYDFYVCLCIYFIRCSGYVS